MRSAKVTRQRHFSFDFLQFRVIVYVKKKKTTAIHIIEYERQLFYYTIMGKWAMNRVVVVVHIIPNLVSLDTARIPLHTSKSHSTTFQFTRCHESFFSLFYLYKNVCLLWPVCCVSIITARWLSSSRGGGSVMTRWIPQTTRQFTACRTI